MLIYLSVYLLLTEAVCFYRPLPQKKLGIPELLVYMKNCLTLGDLLLLVAATLAVTLTGMLMPRITKILTGPVLASGRTSALAGIAACTAAQPALARERRLFHLYRRGGKAPCGLS